MFVRYDKELIPYQGRLAPVQSIAWSPDSSRLAVCNSDNVIFLYDESGEKRDKFNTKSVDSKGEKLSYVVKGIVFSPDSTKLAVGQSDCSVFVYRLGQRWSDRKVICNKFLHKGPVTCLLWPSEQRIVVGSLEGRVRLANPKTNKCSTMYNTGVMVTSLASCDDQGFLSGHADGSIVMYAYQGASSSAARKFCSHSVAPYVLLWSQNTLIAAGSDRRVLVYDADGNLFQQLNYANESTDREVSSAALSPGGQSVALGSYDKFRTYSWSNKKSGWVEGDLILVKNMYTITAMSWKSTERLTLRSRYADEISDVRVLGNDRFVVAKCRNSLLIGDMFSGKFSEILWQSAGNEKFYFEFENACLIFNAGELTVVEYGCNEPLISLKMNTMNPHVISVRINERLGVQVGQVKFMAYAVDPKLIAVVNLSNGSNVAQLSLDHAADWLELNETAKFLLWRDKRRQLFLQDLEIGSKVALLCQCEFVQWVPGSDVIVAQSYGNLCVWYDIRGSTDATVTPIKGEAVQIVRQDGKTFVVIESKSGVYEHELDENMVEFQTAIEDKDFKRAVKYLEGLTGHVEVASMWRQLAQVALQEENLNVAQRCFAATRDVPRVRYILETKNLAARLSDGAVNKGLEHYRVRARIALMRKDFAAAVQFYLNENALDEALEMYLSLHKWEDAIDLAEKQRYSELGSLKERYMNYLMENRRYDDAARVRENEGNFEVATELYLKASLPLKAMKVEEEWGDHLVDQGCTDVAVNHYIESGAMGKALDAAVHSQQWQKALDISQTLENGPTYASQFCQIADHMATLGKYEVCATAIFVTFKSWRLQIAERLYLSAGQQTRSVDMYNKAKMYEDAYRVACKCLNDDELNDRFLEEAGKLEKSGRLKDAEKLYCAMQQPNHAIAMYKNAGQHDSMMRLIEQFHPEHLTNAYVHVAQEMEEEGRFKDAESYYLLANAWKPVVKMYRAVGQWEDAYRIAKEYGGSEAAVQLAFLWASTVRGEAAVMLLQKLDCADKVISFACDHSAFDFAEEVCKLGFNSKLSEVHYKHGLRLEEHDDLEMAEIEFIKADNPKEAVLMYVQRQDWDNARRVAEKHCPAEISEILIGQARELNLWAEALRVARDYLPSQLAALQDEYDALQLSSGPKDVGAFLAQANNWEKQGEYERAVQCYLKITPELTNDAMLLEKSWLRAADIAAKFLEPSAVWLKQIAGCLVTIQRYRQAAELFLQCNEPKEAVDCLMNDSNFEEAKQVAIDYAPELSQYIEQRYKSYLKQQGKADLLANVDLNSAIEVFASRGDWSGALSLAKQRNNTELVNKYALLVLRKQLDNGDYLEAMQTLHNNDLSLTNEVLDMAKTVINAIFDRRLLWDQKGYSTYAALRNYLNDLTKGMSSPPSDEDQVEFFERCLDAAHYQANRIAISFAANDKEVQMVSLKISFSLLRYSDILPADRVFYEAGMAAMKMGGRYANAAFVFLNHFLDICEAVEVNDPSLVEYGDFDGTDIPCPSPLPKTLFASESEQEEVKEWILAASVDKEIKRELPTDDRGVYEACLVNADNSLSDPCILTGLCGAVELFDCCLKQLSIGRGFDVSYTGYNQVEEEWGDHLVDQGCTDVAVNHYIESGAMGKALDAAVHSQQWQKALDISQTLENGPTYASQFCQIADHMATLGKYEVCATAIFVTFKSWRLQIAERLYLSAGQQTRSVDMYNKAKMYEDAYRVACKCLNDDELNDRFLEEAGKLEKSGRLKDAEKLYCAMQQPNHAIAMYKNAGQHDSMMRLIEQFHPEHLTNAYVHVAQEMEEEGRFKDAESYYLLANAWKPVVKMYRAVISFACDHSAFDFAEEVCKLGFNSKLSEVHYKHGLRLEEHDDLEMAEIEFIKADNPKEAVLMYVQRQDWDNARRVAEKHCPAEISEILIGQARELNLWAEALRVARDYLPSQLAALQDEYDALQLSSGPKDVGAFLAQANNWEKQGEYERAVQCYLKITPELTNDAMLLEKSWLRAADIAAKFLEPSAVWLKQIAGCLVTIQRYRQAAELFLQCNEPKEAVDCLMNDSNFEEAKQVAIDYAPELSQYIEQRYKSYLKQQGKADLLANVDLNSAIEVFASRGDWSGALSLAKQRNNTELVNKYALLVLRKQLDNGDYLEAMQTLHNNDLSLTNEVLDMAKTVINAIFDRRLLWDQKGYSTYAALRNYLNDLTKGMSSPPSDEDQVEFFERCLDAAHYQANRIAISFAANDKEVQMVSLKISFSLLRYSDILPADRVFYEAGMAAMKMGGRYANAAFVFLNHFLDICEAVEVNDPSLVEYGDFDGTDIPCPSPLPKTLFASESEQEEVKEWILAASVDKEIKRELPTDDRGVYEACLVNADNSLSDPCILTGYPVIGPRKAFPNATFFANRKDWDKIVMSSKVARSSAMDDMIQYIENWS
ncbi:hypothetical protein M514_12468 [Trichuris suis]|uniref:IFT80/172/WDR35 TPR domain-containing protein n=1 Tax=Trichuris suis TaxID=68888 RepID=A0A085N3V4_9BILA|nr:hypothetical protein M514_12468 [Trichuris suis]